MTTVQRIFSCVVDVIVLSDYCPSAAADIRSSLEIEHRQKSL